MRCDTTRCAMRCARYTCVGASLRTCTRTTMTRAACTCITCARARKNAPTRACAPLASAMAHAHVRFACMHVCIRLAMVHHAWRLSPKAHERHISCGLLSYFAYYHYYYYRAANTNATTNTSTAPTAAESRDYTACARLLEYNDYYYLPRRNSITIARRYDRRLLPPSPISKRARSSRADSERENCVSCDTIALQFTPKENGGRAFVV